MYMAVCYNGISGNNWKFMNPIGGASGQIQYGQDQNILKKWNNDFPPNGYDIARNDFLDSLQGNRNPFVDHPEYACFINFSNMTYVANPAIPCESLGLNKETGLSNVYVAPNPTMDDVAIYVNVASKQNVTLSIIDVAGKVMMEMPISFNAGKNQTLVSLSNLSKGIYTLKISGEQQLFTQKIIKQ
jgi:hypothetical protein